MLAAAGETELLTALEQALPVTTGDTRLARATPPTRRMLLRTLLFLPAVGLRRPWELRGYTGDSLALLTGRRCAYGYRSVERFLAEVAAQDGDAALTNALAAWTRRVWAKSTLADEDKGSASSAFYIDSHRKAVYSDGLIPRGLVARRGAVLGCRTLLLLHDGAGHPLLVTTHRGDLHLTVGTPPLLARYAGVAGASQGRRLIIDREGMAAEFLSALSADGYEVVTVLRADQYAGLSSFTEVGPFTPLRYDRQGAVVREVAAARYALPLPDHPGEQLALRVALVRDLRVQLPRPQPAPPTPDDWLGDLDGSDSFWWREGWTATPAPATPTEPKLIPIVTTASTVDPLALAHTYFGRWPAQENSIKDWLLPLALDTNHGFTRVAVENSEVRKRREELEKRLVTLRRWADGARQRYTQATTRYDRFWRTARERQDVLYREFNQWLWTLEREGVPEHLMRGERRQRKAAIDTAVDALCQRAYRAHDASRQEWTKCERYCREQRTLLRALEDLNAHERTMHELDNRKDQLMTVLKVALTNVAMWARDQWFPVSYAHATWARLAPFFRLPGRVVWGPDVVSIELRPFNDRPLARDLAALCGHVRAVSPHLPDGRRLVLGIAGECRPVLAVPTQAVA